jgi:hypothetical protein
VRSSTTASPSMKRTWPSPLALSRAASSSKGAVSTPMTRPQDRPNWRAATRSVRFRSRCPRSLRRSAGTEPLSREGQGARAGGPEAHVVLPKPQPRGRSRRDALDRAWPFRTNSTGKRERRLAT